MKRNASQKAAHNLVSKTLQITAVLTVTYFIIFSITKRFYGNDKFYYIPLFLFSANFLILVELIYKVKIKKILVTKKEFKNLIGQTVLNLCFVLLVMAYLIW
jgi:hypothetical protein